MEGTVKFNNIPRELKSIPRWTVWKFMERNGRKTKIPMQTNGTTASSTNPEHWSDYFSVEEAYSTNKFDGVGFVFNGDGMVGIDIDKCIDSTGKMSPLARDILDHVKGYAEISPSGTGFKIFTRANIERSQKSDELGLEIYNTSRYFTVTGNVIDTHQEIPQSEQDIQFIFDKYFPKRTTTTRTGDATPDPKYDLVKAEELLKHIDPDDGYDTWLKVGMALHHQFEGDVEAEELWDRWSQQGAKYDGQCSYKWTTFEGYQHERATIGTIIYLAKQAERTKLLEEGSVILDKEDYIQYAEEVINQRYQSEDGVTLTVYADNWYKYDGAKYKMIDGLEVKKAIVEVLNKVIVDNGKNHVKLKTNISIINNTLDHMKVILAKTFEESIPTWFENKYNIEAKELVSLENGLLNINKGVLLPHTPAYLTTYSLPFKFDKEATCPNWLSFMQDVWEEDQESIDCLQEIMGYLLSGDNRQQKFFMLIGPRRSGKGTINRVLSEMIGQQNVISPQLAELTETFGLQPWLNKPLASFTDARLPDRNRSGITSNLLRIVGNDMVTVNRKNEQSWSGHLPTRIIMYSNEMLQLTETTNALSGRMIPLEMTKSFYGKEDPYLIDRLIPELSGIFNWAMQGNERRLARASGQFITPESAKNLSESIAKQNNPLIDFIEDYFVFEKNGYVTTDEAFLVWKHFCHDDNSHPGTKTAFTRKILGTGLDHHVQAVNKKIDGKPKRVYTNIRLNEAGQALVDEQNNMGF